MGSDTSIGNNTIGNAGKANDMHRSTRIPFEKVRGLFEAGTWEFTADDKGTFELFLTRLIAEETSGDKKGPCHQFLFEKKKTGEDSNVQKAFEMIINNYQDKPNKLEKMFTSLYKVAQANGASADDECGKAMEKYCVYQTIDEKVPENKVRASRQKKLEKLLKLAPAAGREYISDKVERLFAMRNYEGVYDPALVVNKGDKKYDSDSSNSNTDVYAANDHDDDRYSEGVDTIYDFGGTGDTEILAANDPELERIVIDKNDPANRVTKDYYDDEGNHVLEFEDGHISKCINMDPSSAIEGRSSRSDDTDEELEGLAPSLKKAFDKMIQDSRRIKKVLPENDKSSTT